MLDTLLGSDGERDMFRKVYPFSPALVQALIAARLDTPRQIVSKWRKRFFEQRLAGLEEQSRGGRPPRFSPQSRRRR